MPKEVLEFTDVDETKTKKADYEKMYNDLKKDYEALNKRFTKLAELYSIVVEKYLGS